MAEVRSGSFNTTGYSDPGYTDHYVFSWSLVSQSIANNTSTISWSVTGAGGTNSAYWTYVQEKYVTVNGVTQTNTTKVATYNGTVAFSGQSTIKHSSNGKGSFSASCGGAFYYYGSYNSTGSGSWDLPTIARATTPTLSATSVTMGSAVTINLAPADSSFKHKLSYSFGSLSYQATGLASGTGFTASGNVTVNFTPPTTLGSQIPNANSGDCYIKCDTYKSDGTHVGSTTKMITLSVPSYTPGATVALTGVNLLSSTYVQSKSSVKVSITAATSYGATIKSYSTVIDGKTYTTSSFTTSVLSSGTKTATTTITDSRGKTVTVNSASITVFAYSIPYVTSFSLARQTDGTTVIATLKGGFAAVNNKNAKTVKVTLNGVTNTVTTSAYTFDTTTTFTGVPTDNTLTGKLTLTDSYTTVTKDAVLPTVSVTMDFYKDGNGIAMGKVAEEGNLLDVVWNIKNDTVPTLLGGLGKAIPADTDINTSTYINPGNYVCAANATATTLKNCPTTVAFKMRVSNCLSVQRDVQSGGTAYPIREITDYNGQSWIQNVRKQNGAWVFYPWRLLLDSTNCPDYVVDSGTSGVWRYTKWNSGFAECFGYHTISGTNISTAWGSWYASGAIVLPSFPFTFVGAPDVHVGWESDFSAIIDGVSKRESTKAGQVYLYRPVAQTNVNGRFSIYAYGKWK